jgi:hypothetical protein
MKSKKLPFPAILRERREEPGVHLKSFKIAMKFGSISGEF